MIFTLIRILIVVICLIIVILFFRKKKIKMTKLKLVIIIFSTICVLFVLNLFPIEGNFLKFNSVAEAFQYSYAGESITEILYEEDCAFIISTKNSNSISVHTITKLGNKWGMVDFNSRNKFYRSGFIESKYGPSGRVHLLGNVVLNKDSNKRISVLSGYFSGNIECPKLLSEEKKQYTVLKNELQQSGAKYLQYYKIEDGNFPTEFSVYLNDEKITLK